MKLIQKDKTAQTRQLAVTPTCVAEELQVDGRNGRLRRFTLKLPELEPPDESVPEHLIPSQAAHMYMLKCCSCVRLLHTEYKLFLHCKNIRTHLDS